MPDSLQCYLLQTLNLVVQRGCLSVNHQVHILGIRRRRAPDFLLGWFFCIPDSFPVFIPALVRGADEEHLLPGKLSSRPEFLTEGERRGVLVQGPLILHMGCRAPSMSREGASTVCPLSGCTDWLIMIGSCDLLLFHVEVHIY